MNLTRNIGLLLAAFIVPHLYTRVQTLWSLEANAPGKIKNFSAFPSHEVKFENQVQNCEDVILLDDSNGWALFSCDAGRDHWNTVMGIFTNGSHTQGKLYLYNYASPKTESLIPLNILDFPQALTDFHPLGIEYHAPSHTLYVINHAMAGPRLELFRLFLKENSATHIRTITHPKIHSPNAIAVIDEENIYLTNDHYFLCRYHPYLALAESYLAIPGGNVMHVHLPSLHITTLAHIPFANGVKLVNETTLAVASTSSTRVNLYDIGVKKQADGKTDAHSAKLIKTIKVPFLPDNLSVDSANNLIITGHGHMPSLAAFAFSRAKCRYGSAKGRYGSRDNDDVKVSADEQIEACKSVAPSYVVQWNDETSSEEGFETLFVDDGSEFSTSSTAVRDVERGVGIVSGLFESGIVVWKE